MRSPLPWHRFGLDTAWSPADAARELRQLLSERSAPGQVEQAPHGTAQGAAFRMAWGEPSAIGRSPIMISGRVQPTPAGSHVVVTMRLPLPALLLFFIAVPLLGLLSAAVSIAALVRHEGIVLLVWIMPFALCRGILRWFRRDALACEAFFRGFFPPITPPNAGPFR
jgi:hypothetical protein